MEWQPIETAPHDGTPVLVAWRVRSGWEVHSAYSVGDGWCDAYHRARIGAVEMPEFWMPLPAAPSN